MCFSPEMDLAAGLVITAVGVDAVRRSTTPGQRAVAGLPVLFGVHQLIETLVWWELQGHLPQGVGDVATWVYLLIALTVVPIAVPVAFRSLGEARWPRVGQALVGLGVFAGLAGLWGLGLEPVPHHIHGHHVCYSPGVPLLEVTFGAYVLAACAPALIARSRPLQWFGVGNLVAVSVLVWLDRTAVISLWCVWAAVTSVLVNIYVRRAAEAGARPQARVAA